MEERKKYQVFVSSTYEDLQPERQEIMHALLELDCIPSGMELFPAANEDQWTLIKGVIDDSDYYIVIIGGRYGSVGPGGISYTEMEYRYAVEQGKPVIAFLHKDPDSLEKRKTETSKKGQKALEAFRDLCKTRMCKFWETPQELGSIVSRSLIMLQKKHPGIGWIRGDAVASKEASKEILDLRLKIEDLNKELEKVTTHAPAGSEKLEQGDDEFGISIHFQASDDEHNNYRCRITVKEAWDDIFYIISPLMIHEATDLQLKRRLNETYSKIAATKAKKDKNFKDLKRYRNFEIDSDNYETIKIQLRALGLITQSIKQRSVKDTASYWKLTPYGDSVMVRLRAIEK
ncbi:hypothetical protein DDZ13_07435 [Coraliomargarita sinensis]|uniref:DUF4062 domain-containing protein n=1 Tax=Coraliomargarita sinensis TaxID=2174842 RepID=A0A317ZFR7_9BACT|nr:DUF4062 domain-containing protein [Coraliomargarita sinensis]PXA04356.1 hypothetical protein DDZ13_07435 [Coraliomargarita sinensis]